MATLYYRPYTSDPITDGDLPEEVGSSTPLPAGALADYDYIFPAGPASTARRPPGGAAAAAAPLSNSLVPKLHNNGPDYIAQLDGQLGEIEKYRDALRKMGQDILRCATGFASWRWRIPRSDGIWEVIRMRRKFFRTAWNWMAFPGLSSWLAMPPAAEPARQRGPAAAVQGQSAPAAKRTDRWQPISGRHGTPGWRARVSAAAASTTAGTGC
ncbi:hypothetical protein BOX15_Mlig026285g1 [Macrostomum lignano]|uniref:Uncharacterized protein n=1 Tax=Macrostomum lignano TaxID=282301 RepID=A0A267FG24_9PLAT|nr:hypothetical protein BOX15_Mlig026285g1 [Macrostomum lignano]